MTETWVHAPGHPGHIVSSEGRIRHRRVNAPILKGYIDADGYRRVRLDNIERRVHRLVCEAFHGSPPAGTVCAHADGDPLNNAASNLRWATAAENAADTIRMGRFHYAPAASGEQHPGAKLSDAQVAMMRDLADQGVSQRKIATQIGVSQGHVSRVLAGKKRPKDIAQPKAGDQS